MIDFDKPNKSVSVWLLVVMLLVMAIIVVGGGTRLTNSGLSITEWAPIRGSLPPLSHEAWLAEFEKYKLIPEFEAEHPDMDLAGFKAIYFWEWAHRQLGRIIGLAYLLPFIYFTVRRKLPKRNFRPFLLPLVLIGLQGAIGWWMVHSGLQEGMVDVSHYRLATHLGMAFIILGVLYWLRKSHNNGFRPTKIHAEYKKRTALLGVMVFIQIIAGAFVAGTKSGRSYNEWPLMDGDFIPAGYGAMSPLWLNAFENTAAIQFNHRFLAYILFGFALWVCFSMRKSQYMRSISVMLLGILFWQVGLGIMTLLSGDNFDPAHIKLALLHQFSAVFVFIVALAMAWKSRHFVR
ncbi:cytochrome c oxidase assembly protein subunit 15 [Litorimonas taeanensis]|uniref:Heme A synthase n=1 Tax=Litorimonas taeanensis TaxID=568099 RepID=A0A420WK79_9PROT|nr:COX15/CtaA family protein [Litorimonas taeanensis]RKQ71418.1 cytochrome c oxidase assembly protein subunit 15 [Litorimonas taeanensis]